MSELQYISQHCAQRGKVFLFVLYCCFSILHRYLSGAGGFLNMALGVKIKPLLQAVILGEEPSWKLS